MPRQESEENDAAPLPSGFRFTTQIKAKCNDGAGHADPDDERMDTESDPDVEKQFGESPGKKPCYAGPLTNRVIKQWTIGPDAKLEDKVIEHEIYTGMKLFMHASGLKKTPRHKQKDTDIDLWKQYSKEYYNKRTCEWTRPFRCPMHYRFLSFIFHGYVRGRRPPAARRITTPDEHSNRSESDHDCSSSSDECHSEPGEPESSHIISNHIPYISLSNTRRYPLNI